MAEVQHDIPTTLNYYAPIGDESEPPFRYTYPRPPGELRTNVGNDPRPVVVHDARGKENEFSLDKTGFQFVNWPSVEKDFVDEEQIKAQYYPEVEELLKKIVGAKRVVIFDHTIRRKAEDKDLNQSDPNNQGPAELVHVDQTYKASIARVHYHLKDEAEELLKGRVRIINVWRPIGNPVAHKPLAVYCSSFFRNSIAVSDWRSLEPKDLVPARLIYPHREGSTFSVRYNPNHRWWHLHGQTPDEVTLIKCFDSREDVARLTPHSAFPDSASLPEEPHRQSIEIRALVFSDE